MKFKFLVIVLLSVLILSSCSEDNPIISCDDFITLKTKEQIISENGYKSCNVYLTRYVDGVLDPSSKYLLKTQFFRNDGYHDSTVVYEESGEIKHCSKYIYDDHNNNIGWTDFYPDNTSNTTMIQEYIYDDNDLLIRINNLGNSGEIMEYTTYEYNSDNMISKVYRYTYMGVLMTRSEYFYHGCTKPKEIKSYNNSGLILTVRIEYDKYGNEILYKRTLPNGGEETLDFSDNYDDWGRIIEAISLMNERLVFSYNSDNLIISETHFDQIDENKPVMIYEHKYLK